VTKLSVDVFALSFTFALMMTEAFSRYIGKVSDLKLISANTISKVFTLCYKYKWSVVKLRLLTMHTMHLVLPRAHC